MVGSTAGNNVLEGDFDPLLIDGGPVWSFATASTEVTGEAVTFEIVAAPCPMLANAVSRKTHGSGPAARDYDVELYPGHYGTAGVGIECRSGYINRLVLDFSPSVLLDCSNIQINEGSAVCVATTDLAGGSSWEVTLAGNQNEECLEVEVVGIGLSGERVIRGMNQIADVDANGVVNILDLSKIKEPIIQGVIDTINPRTDLDLSGGINILDLSIAKSNLGRFAYCGP